MVAFAPFHLIRKKIIKQNLKDSFSFFSLSLSFVNLVDTRVTNIIFDRKRKIKINQN